MSRVDNTGGSGFTVDNGTGLVVRTKLNQIVAALSTLNQGSGDPSIGVAAYVPHIDGNTLKIRNAANNAFVSLGDVSATNFGHAGLSAANTFTSTNIFQDDVTLTGAAANVVFDKSDNALEFADNAKAVFGAGGDLTVSHDGTDSTLANTTGELVLKGDTLKLKQNTADEVYLVATANGSVELYENNVKKFETTTAGVSLSGNATSALSTLTDASTITVDFASASHFTVTLGGNRTFSTSNTSSSIGSSGSIFLVQDGTGSRAPSFGGAYKFVGGTAPTLTTTANAVDRIDYIVRAADNIHCAVSLDVK